MKVLAYLERTFDSRIITVFEALRRRREEPDQWEKRKYFDLSALREMKATDRGPSSSFSYTAGTGGGHDRGSKGIAHELAQDYLCRSQTLTFLLFGGRAEFSVKIERAEDEVLIEDPANPNRRAYVDVMLHLAPDSPGQDVWGDRIAVEITDTHPNTRRKERLLADLRIGAIEIPIIRDWHKPNGVEVSSEELARLRARISGFWRARIHANCIFARRRILPRAA